jgi:hypothetical protein
VTSTRKLKPLDFYREFEAAARQHSLYFENEISSLPDGTKYQAALGGMELRPSDGLHEREKNEIKSKLANFARS